MRRETAKEDLALVRQKLSEVAADIRDRYGVNTTLLGQVDAIASAVQQLQWELGRIDMLTETVEAGELPS